MTTYDIPKIVRLLSSERPVFHNEADFQFALAWKIQKENPDSEIRLEYRISEFPSRYTDIWIKDENPVAIELKYKPVSITFENKDETFELKKHGAEDIGRYDFLKDIQRIEEIVLRRPKTTGYVIILTNDHLYWQNSRKKDPVDLAFRIHEGKDLNGVLSWSQEAGKKTTEGREEPIIIKGHYKCNWDTYSTVNISKFGNFEMLCFKIVELS